ncbi:hypothetical protein [Streptomyces hygroscopicus]|uniref:hypothetical protein n=1 Tax=Streptomyces hygroscopicus TaxID=1912 RepID=UPI0036971DDC
MPNDTLRSFLGAVALADSTTGPPWLAAVSLAAVSQALAATAFTVAEMLHATISWEPSVALAPPPNAQGAYLGVYGLAQAVQRSAGPLAVTAAIAAGPLGPLGRLGLAGVRGAQRHLVRDGGDGALSVAPVTVSEH